MNISGWPAPGTLGAVIYWSRVTSSVMLGHLNFDRTVMVCDSFSEA